MKRNKFKDPKYMSAYYLKNKEKMDVCSKQYYKEHGNPYSNEKSKKCRLSIIKYLGKKCVKCGFKDIRALQLDHIKGGGNQEVKMRKGMVRVYRYYAEHLDEVDSHLQVLCANCNWIKRYVKKEVRK